MRKLKLLAFALICAVFAPAKADEGMWLLQLMQEQNLERCRRYFRARMYG